MSIVSTLQKQIDTGILRPDDTQLRAAQTLDRLSRQLKNYKANKKYMFMGQTTPPKGIYMWGSVGRGKSMLMDMFFHDIPVVRKTRVHFHEFMQDIHSQINTWRKMDKKERKRQPQYVRKAGDDPIAPTAKAIAQHSTVLCFDEFHVTDIADAMILARLFGALWDRGVVIVATSNRAPDDLYKDGLNRSLFLPFIEDLKRHLEIFSFDGHTDHRLRTLAKGEVYFTPLSPKTNRQIEELWQNLIGPTTPAPRKLSIQGRTLTLLAAGDIAKAGFADLCAQALGAADYLEIARQFSTLFLRDVPKLGPENRNEAKRFVTLVDALYEAKTKLIMSADAPPTDLYPDGDGQFEFERTASRLIEMQSLDYLGSEHV